MVKKILFVTIVLIWSSCTFADVKLQHESGTSREVIIENEFIKMVIDPDRGGCIVSFVHKPAGKEIVMRDKPYFGLFIDHMWAQGYPGELIGVPYEIKLEKTGPEEVIITLSREMKGEWNGRQEVLQGLLIEKTFKVKSGQDAVFCSVCIKNTQKEGRLPNYWVQHVFYIGGDYNAKEDIFYRPSCRGVIRTFQGSVQGDYLKDPYAGWSAGIDTVKKQGLVFLMDYNYLDQLYNNARNQTLEWMYDKVPIPPGKEWKTDIIMVPTFEMSNIFHTSKSIIAGLEVIQKGKLILLTHQLRGTLGQIEDVTLSVELESITDHRKIKVAPLNIGNVTIKPKIFSQSVETDILAPLIVNVLVKGKTGTNEFQEQYFIFHSGGFGFGGENLQPDTVTPLYKVTRPEKNQVLMKPEKIYRIKKDKIHILVLEGLTADNYRIDEILGNLTGNITHGYYTQTGYAGSNLNYFPYDYNTLMSQDVIIIANANIDCLGKLGLEMLRDYVLNGGNLLFLGGKASYGAGGLRNSGLEELLPIEVLPGFFDIKPLDNASLVLTDTVHSITRNIDLSARPICTYIHKVKVKKDAKVLINAGKETFLVIRENKGGGRVACFLGTPYGIEKDKRVSSIYFSWDGWSSLLRNVFIWLVEQKNEEGSKR